MFQLIARDCGNDAVALIGLMAIAIDEDHWMPWGFENGALVHARPRPLTDRVRSLAYRHTDLMDASEIMGQQWWPTSAQGAAGGAAFLRPSPEPGYAFFISAIQAKSTTIPLPFEHLSTLDGQGRLMAAEPVNATGRNLHQMFTEPLWGPRRVAFASTFGYTARTVADVLRTQAFAIVQAEGQNDALRALRNIHDPMADEMWSLFVGNLVSDPMYKATVAFLGRDHYGSLETTYTVEQCAQRSARMREALRHVMLGQA